MKLTQNDAISIPSLTDKQLLCIPLFRTVKNVNGDHAFRQLLAKKEIIQCNSQIFLNKLQSKQFFVFVLEGKIAIFKRSNQQNRIIRIFTVGQYWGHQDFGLNINQNLQIKSVQKCQLMLIPLDILHTCFRRVITLTNLKTKTQYLKNFPPFKSQQIQKLLKLAAYCEKKTVPRNYILCRKGNKIENIFIIIEGKLEHLQKDDQTNEIKKNTLIGYQDIKNGFLQYPKTLKAVHSSEVLSIPLGQLEKVIELKNKLNQTNFFHYQEESPLPSRPNTSLFSQKAMSTVPAKSVHSRRYNTEMLSTSIKFHNRAEQPQKLSISDIYLLKFIRRKQKKQQKQPMKFIKTRAPQVVIDLNKHYSLMKPLYTGKSQYVKNYKWKLKKSNKISQRNSCSVHSFASQFYTQP